jgi:hypothetical protein
MKNKETSNLLCVCDQCVTKYQNAKFKEDRHFVNEVESQLKEKPLRGNQTQGFHYSKTKLVTKQ